MEEEGTLHYLAGDHLGTTSVVFSSAGALVAESRHYPYGEERWSSGTVPTDYRFTGQLLESDLSIYIMGARWYDPYIARWLSADTVVPNPAQPQGLNRYAYVYGCPVSRTDPSGHCLPEESWCKPHIESEYIFGFPSDWMAVVNPYEPRKRLPPKKLLKAGMKWAEVVEPHLTYYYTPQITDSEISNANDLPESTLDHAADQGSLVLNGETWKHSLKTGRFHKLTHNPCPGGVPLHGFTECTHGPHTQPNDESIIYLTGAVKSEEGRFDQGAEPIYITHSGKETLVVTPFDSGGLQVNGIDLYFGIFNRKPDWSALGLQSRSEPTDPIAWIQAPGSAY